MFVHAVVLPSARCCACYLAHRPTQRAWPGPAVMDPLYASAAQHRTTHLCVFAVPSALHLRPQAQAQSCIASVDQFIDIDSIVRCVHYLLHCVTLILAAITCIRPC